MNKRYPKNMILFLLTLLCAFTLTVPAWASVKTGSDADPGSAVNTGTISGQSRVLTCGGESAEAKSASASSGTSAAGIGTRGASLGRYTTTGYCSCDQCSGGHNLTYSGTVPQAQHTVSADLSVFPIGTKLMIGDVVYTVEDMGSSVKGNWIDIFYGSHEDAVTHGTEYDVEVFAVE